MTAVSDPIVAAAMADELIGMLFDAAVRKGGGQLAHPVSAPATVRIPECDESAMAASVEASTAIAEVLNILNGIERGIAGKPWPLHSALRTYIKHANSELCVALRDLRDFRSLINENDAHE